MQTTANVNRRNSMNASTRRGSLDSTNSERRASMGDGAAKRTSLFRSVVTMSKKLRRSSNSDRSLRNKRNSWEQQILKKNSFSDAIDDTEYSSSAPILSLRHCESFQNSDDDYRFIFAEQQEDNINEQKKQLSMDDSFFWISKTALIVYFIFLMAFVSGEYNLLRLVPLTLIVHIGTIFNNFFKDSDIMLYLQQLRGYFLHAKDNHSPDMDVRGSKLNKSGGKRNLMRRNSVAFGALSAIPQEPIGKDVHDHSCHF